MKLNLYKQKNTYFLIFFYFTALILTLFVLEDFGIHIEEKFHRLNGLFWLSYISDVFGFEYLKQVTETKMSGIFDYTLNRPSYFNRYGIVLDLPAALIEVIFNIDDIKTVYYLKHFLGFSLFLISSFFFYKILEKRYNNFLLSIIGLILYLTTPRIFGDSFLYKDVLYLSFFTISLYFFVQSIDQLNYKNLLFLGLFSSLSVNLRIFSLLIPIIFIFIIFIKNFFKKNLVEDAKKVFFYLIFFIIFLYLFWPYLWSDPLKNFLDLFRYLTRDLIDVKILYGGDYISNRIVPDIYILNWIFISSPLVLSGLSFFGILFYLYRFIKRFTKIKSELIYNDLWRSAKEEKDFIIFIFLITFFMLFLLLNAPLYNGWRLLYFFHIFIIYFAINFLYLLKVSFRKKSIFKALYLVISFFAVVYNFISILLTHPYQSIYFNSILNSKIINNYEGDYHGVAAKDFFEKILEIDNKNNFIIAVASHTPIQRGLEALPKSLNKKFNIVGQNYNIADYIFKNNISEVNSDLIKKYEVPENFSKIYTKKKGELIIYEIYKRD